MQCGKRNSGIFRITKRDNSSFSFMVLYCNGSIEWNKVELTILCVCVCECVLQLHAAICYGSKLLEIYDCIDWTWIFFTFSSQHQMHTQLRIKWVITFDRTSSSLWSLFLSRFFLMCLFCSSKLLCPTLQWRIMFEICYYFHITTIDVKCGALDKSKVNFDYFANALLLIESAQNGWQKQWKWQTLR